MNSEPYRDSPRLGYMSTPSVHISFKDNQLKYR